MESVQAATSLASLLPWGRVVMQMLRCVRVEWSGRAANSVCTLSPPCGERVASAEGASRVRGSLAPRNLPSPAGLTRGSILFVRTFLRTGWIAGSSPAMTTAIAARIGPSPDPRHSALKTRVDALKARATLSPLCGERAQRVRGASRFKQQRISPTGGVPSQTSRATAAA